MRALSASSVVSALLILAGAMLAVLVSGTQDVWAVITLLAFAGLGLLVGTPVVLPRTWPMVGAALFCLFSLAAFLPQAWLPIPGWRVSLSVATEIGLAASVSPQPWIGWFWWWLVVAACVTSLYLQTLRLERGSLALLLHAVAVFAGLYAALSIFADQTGWRFPFSGGAPFGFLPNRNHTATLMVIGSVLSIGLMYWEATSGRRGAAFVAALAAAPCLAALLFFSISRAGLLFLAVGVALWALGTARGGARRTVLVVAAAVGAFLAVLFAIGQNELRSRLVSVGEEVLSVQSGADTAQIDFRVPILRDTMNMIREVPLTGAGLGQFEYVFPQYRFHSARAARVIHPESDWLMVAAESGVPAAVVLLAIFVWFMAVCWRARGEDDGPLRWAAASAIGAAALHGMIDVPWHRCSLGWLMLVVASFVVPAGRGIFAHPRLMRSFFAAAGLLLAAWSAKLAFDFSRSATAPPPFAWGSLEGRIRALGDAQKMPEAIALARKAVAAFPLKHEAYYYLGGLLRYYESTEQEIDNLFRAGRLVEPVLPQPVADQARLWQPLDAQRQIMLSAEAINRARIIEQRERRKEYSDTARAVDEAARVAGLNTGVQLFLAEQMSGDSRALAIWFCAAPSDAASAWADRQASEAPRFLDSLEPPLRSRVLERWVTLPSAPTAAAFMEARNVGSPGPYWRQLAAYYAKAGDKARAVGIVAQAEGVALDGSLPEGEFARQLAALQEQGNEVAMRRLLKEAAEVERADPDKLRVAMASYAASGDWEMAWKAASRLATATKNRQ